MFRFVALLVALTVGSSAFAQTATQPHHKKKKAAPVTDQTTTPEPADISAVPQNVQKWVGSTMDDILTGTGKAIDDVGGKN